MRKANLLWRLGSWLCARFGKSLGPNKAIALFEGGAVAELDINAPPGHRIKALYGAGPAAVEKARAFVEVVEREQPRCYPPWLYPGREE